MLKTYKTTKSFTEIKRAFGIDGVILSVTPLGNGFVEFEVAYEEPSLNKVLEDAKKRLEKQINEVVGKY